MAQNTNLDTVIVIPCEDVTFSAAEIEMLKIEVVRTGNVHSYVNLLSSNGKRDETTLMYSLIMANKYNHLHAYYDVYQTLIEVSEHYCFEIDSTTLAFALDYLEKGAALGGTRCVYELARLYLNGKYVEQDTDKAKSYLAILHAGEDFESRWWDAFVKTFSDHK